MRGRDKTNARRIIPVCAILSACAILLLIRSGKVPSLLTLGKRDSSSKSILRDTSTRRYFYNRTAVRFKKLSEVRQCYYSSRSFRKQLLDIDSRDAIGCRQRVPNVIIVGAKEGGEATVRFFLDKHPSVIFPLSGTLNYFSKSTFRKVKGKSWYLEKMPYASPDQVTIETGTDYFASSMAPDAIRNDIMPKPKLLVILRDPVKRALLEYYSEQSAKMNPPARTLMKRAGQYPYLDSLLYFGDSFASSVINDEGDVNVWNGLVNVGMYVIQLRRWYEWFGRSQVMTIDGDRLENDPVPLLQEIEDFIGVPRYFDETTVSIKPDSKTYCLQKPFYECPPPMTSYPSPDQSTVTILRSFYGRYDRQLYQMLGRNFTWFKNSLFVNKSAVSLSETHQTAEDNAPIQESSDQLLEEEQMDDNSPHNKNEYNAL